MFCGVTVTDFQSPCGSMLRSNMNDYSDISDKEEVFGKPKFRLVHITLKVHNTFKYISIFWS